ncbi:hypothetical protein PAMP_002504 [Pampus punctatissimus]
MSRLLESRRQDRMKEMNLKRRCLRACDAPQTPKNMKQKQGEGASEAAREGGEGAGEQASAH